MKKNHEMNLFYNPHKLTQMLRRDLLSFPLHLLMLMALIVLSPIGCVDLEYDQPPAGGGDPNLSVNTTIAELKAMHVLDEYEQITTDAVLSAIVISDDEAGNFFKQLVIADATGGIEMRIEMTDIHNVYPVGRKIYLRAKGLWLGDYNGLIQLGAGVDPVTGDLIRIPESLLAEFLVPATYNNPVVPALKTIDQLSLSDVSTLVRFENVQFTSADAGETYADPVLQQSLNRDIEDCTKKNLIVRSSGFASFAGELTPEGNGTLTGVLGIFGSDYQIMIRDLEDVSMTGDRCASNTVTINAVRDMFTGSTTTFPSGSIKGIVTSDRNSQSVTSRNLYLQDATGGIVIRFNSDHFFNLGDEIIVDASGATLGEFNGLLQLEGIATGSATFEGSPGDVTPREATVLEVLTNAQEWESTVVKITDATLSGNTVYSGSVTVTDATGSMVLFTRSQATFSGNALPTGLVSVTALVSEFNTPQLIIRNPSDVSGGGTGGGEDIDESFDNIANDADVVLPGWSNIAVKGTRIWRGKVFMTNHYAQATSFGDTENEMETWMITPPIVLDVAKKITFESAKAFHVHDGLTVWISSNFNGSDVNGATWTQLFPTLAGASDADNAFIPSGDIDLSGFTGPVRVGFKYVGSGPGGQTTTFRIDNVKVEKL